MVNAMVSSAFAPLIGQAPAVELLTCAVTQNRIAPAYLFAGSKGVGRSLAARCFAELVLSNSQKPAASLRHRIDQGNHPDLLWVEPTYSHQGKLLSPVEASEMGLKRKTPPVIRLEQVRQIAQFLGRPPLEAPRSVVVLNQVETMAEAAANGLLKTLEEPGQATLILLAPGVDALLPTLVSRCQRIPFYRLSETDLAQVLTQAGYAEILQQPQVLAIAQGSPGEAIASWQQLQAIPSELLDAATQIPRSVRAALDLARQIDKTLDTENQLWLITYLQHHYWQAQAKPGLLQQLETARRHLLNSVQPRLVWEVTLMATVDL